MSEKKKSGVKPRIKTLSAKFVESSELVRTFMPSGMVDEVWTMLCESNPPFTWGDNNRSLVCANDFADALTRASETFEFMDDGERREFEKGVTGIKELGDLYVDLEN